MNKLIRQSVYFLGATYFTIYMSKFLGTAAAWLAFWPIYLANDMGRFILTRDILTYGLLNIAWIIIFPEFIVSLFQYKNSKIQETDWRTAPKPKKEFVSVMEQVGCKPYDHPCCNHTAGSTMVHPTGIDNKGHITFGPVNVDTRPKKVKEIDARVAELDAAIHDPKSFEKLGVIGADNALKEVAQLLKKRNKILNKSKKKNKKNKKKNK